MTIKHDIDRRTDAQQAQDELVARAIADGTFTLLPRIERVQSIARAQRKKRARNRAKEMGRGKKCEEGCRFGAVQLGPQFLMTPSILNTGEDPMAKKERTGIREGKTKKQGLRSEPTAPRPLEPPAGQGVAFQDDKLDAHIAYSQGVDYLRHLNEKYTFAATQGVTTVELAEIGPELQGLLALMEQGINEEIIETFPYGEKEKNDGQQGD
jgi:hypothetical protein